MPLLLLLHIQYFRGPATKVRVGLINLLDPGDFMQERKIAENIKHTNYNHVDQYHDIGLIRLVQPLKLNSQVRPACLEINSQTPGNSAIASGFGKTSYGSYFRLLYNCINSIIIIFSYF